MLVNQCTSGVLSVGANKKTIPCVSICIPTYNNPKGLRRLLDSIVNQDFHDYEVIITDDSTNDEIKKISATYQKKITSLNYIKNPHALGSPRNWNRAISFAKGDYIKIMHHDDWMLESNSLRAFVEAAKLHAGEPVFIFSASKAINPKGKIVGTNLPAADTIQSIMTNPSRLILANLIGAPSAVMYSNRRGLKFDANLIWLVDVDFYMSLIRSGFKVEYLNMPYVATTAQSSSQITHAVQNDLNVELYEYMYMFEKWGFSCLFKPKSLSVLNSMLNKYAIKSMRDVNAVKLSYRAKVIIYGLIMARRIKRRLIR